MNINSYPSVIARPYFMAVKETPQRKDFQRFLLENTVSFMASVAVANVIDLFNNLITSEQPDIEKIKEIKKSLIIDFDRMALGTWCRVLRETVDKVLSKEERKNLFIPEICDFYATKTRVEATINELVSIRNKDAHGNPIPEKKLKQELDRRQKLLDSVMDALEFLENYKLLVVESFDITDRGAIYNAREYTGSGYKTIEITAIDNFPLHTPILYKEKEKSFLNLSPLCCYSKLEGSEDMQIALFSKKIPQEDKVEYLNIDGPSIINLQKYDEEWDMKYSERFEILEEIYSDPSNEPVANVEFYADLRMSDKVLNISEEGVITFEFINKKNSTELYNLALVLDLPDTFDINISELPKENVSLNKETQTLLIHYEVIPEGTKETLSFPFTATAEGTYTIRPGILTAKYWQKESDKEKSKNADEAMSEINIDIPLASIEIKDPNSRNKVCPIINAYKRFVNLIPEKYDFEIGENFLFELTLENIGLSTAYNVQLEIIFPQELKLVDGNETIITSLNPSESRTFKYIVRTRTPGIYNIIVRDIKYSDAEGRDYLTRLNEDFKVLVKSNVSKELKYYIEDAYYDLYLSEEEETYMKFQIDKFAILSEEMKQKYRFDAIVYHVRELIKNKCSNKNIKVSETLYTELKRNLKRKNKASDFQVEEPRQAIIFAIKECPFFAINVSNKENIEFYGYESLAKKIYSGLIRDDQYIFAGLNYELTNVLKYNDIERVELRGKQKLGRILFSTWIDKAIESLQKTILRMKEFAGIISKSYKISFSIKSDSQIIANLHEEFAKHSGFSHNHIWIIRNPNAAEKEKANFRIVFSCTKEALRFIDEDLFKTSGIKNMSFNEKDGHLYSAVPWKFYDALETPKQPLIAYEINPRDDLENALEVVEQIRIAILRAHTRSLFERENFAKLNHISVILNALDDLFDAGIAFMQSDFHRHLHAYSYKAFLPGEPSFGGYLATIESSGKKLTTFVKFFTPITLSDEEADLIEISLRFYTNDIVRGWLFKIDKSKDENEFAASTFIKILKAAASYSKNACMIVPQQFFRDYFEHYCRTFTALPILIRKIYESGGTLHITKEFDIGLDKKEIIKTVRRFRDHEKKYYIDSFLKITGSNDDITISITQPYKAWIDEIIEDNPTLDFCDAGDLGKVREYLNFFKQAHPLLAKKTVGNGWVYQTFPFKTWNCKAGFGINVHPKNGLGFWSWILDSREKGEDLVELLKREFPKKRIANIRTSGRQKQHVTIDGEAFDHNNYQNFSDENWKKTVFDELKEIFALWEEFFKKYKTVE